MAGCPNTTNTSLNQSFSYSNEEGSLKIEESSDSRVDDKRVDIFYDEVAGGIREVLSTFGIVKKLGKITRTFEEIITWSGENEKELSYPKSFNVVTEDLGDYVTFSGTVISNPSFFYDLETGLLKVASKAKIYGATKISFQSVADVYRIDYGDVEFTDVPIKYTVVAFALSGAAASVELSRGDIQVNFTDKGDERLALNLKPIGGHWSFGFTDGGVYVVPVKAYPFPSQGQSYWSGVAYEPTDIKYGVSSDMETIVEFLNFQNSSTINLQTAPMTILGGFGKSAVKSIDVFGDIKDADGNVLKSYKFIYPDEFTSDGINQFSIGRAQIAVEQVGSVVKVSGAVRVIYEVPVAFIDVPILIPGHFGFNSSNFEAKAQGALVVRDGVDVVTFTGEISPDRTSGSDVATNPSQNSASDVATNINGN